MVLISLASFSFSSLASQLEKELKSSFPPDLPISSHRNFPQYFPSLLFFHAFLPSLVIFFHVFLNLFIFASCNLLPCPFISFLESEVIPCSPESLLPSCDASPNLPVILLHTYKWLLTLQSITSLFVFVFFSLKQLLPMMCSFPVKLITEMLLSYRT